MIMIQKALQPKDDIDLLYVSRKGGRGLASNEDWVDVSIRRLEHHIKKDQRKINYGGQ